MDIELWLILYILNVAAKEEYSMGVMNYISMGSILKQTGRVSSPKWGVGEIAQLVQIVQLRNSCSNLEYSDMELWLSLNSL